MIKHISITYYIKPTCYKDIVSVRAFKITRNECNMMFYHLERTVMPFETKLYICQSPLYKHISFFEPEDIIDKDVTHCDRILICG